MLSQESDENNKNQRSRVETFFRSVDTVDRAFLEWFAASEIVDEHGWPLVVFHGTQNEFAVFDPDASSFRVSGNDPTAYVGSHFAREPSVASRFAQGMYNSDSTGEGGHVIPVYLSLQNVYRTTESEMLDWMMSNSYDIPSVESTIIAEGWRIGLNEYESFLRYDRNDEFRILVNSRALHEETQYEEPCDDLARTMGEMFKRHLMDLGYDGIEYKNEKEGGTSYIAFEQGAIKSALSNTGVFSRNNPDFADGFCHVTLGIDLFMTWNGNRTQAQRKKASLEENTGAENANCFSLY